MSKILRSPPQKCPVTRSDSDIPTLCTKEVPVTPGVVNITQRTKRRCPPAEDINLADLKNELKKELSDILNDFINSRLDRIENHIIELKAVTSKIDETNKDIEKSMSSVTEQLTSLELKISGLEVERKSMSTKLAALEEKLDSLDRSLVKTSVELRNVPKRLKESKNNLYDAMLELSKHLKLNLEVSDIRDVSRQPSKKENPNSAITVEFTNTLIKSNFLTAVKSYNKDNHNNKLSSFHLGLDAVNTPIFVAEQLTTQAKRLFYLTRNCAKANQYLYCWTSNGRIMLKKDQDSQIFIIRNEQQLKDLFTLSKA